MHPILIRLGSLPIHTFGVCMGTGFLVGILYSLRQCRRWGLDADQVFNLCFWIMVSGVLGARALYIAIDLGQKGHDSEFWSVNVFKLFALWEGGLVWYGGFIAAAIVTLLYARAQKMPVWRTADLLTPATFMGLAIGRIGCLMAGDDFGRPTHVPWAIVFHNPESLIYPPSLLGQPIHPTQIYMEAKSFFVAFVCHLVLQKWKKFDGQVIAIALMLYSVLRFIVEIYRFDMDRGFLPGTPLSTSQAIGIVVFVLGGFMLWYMPRFTPPRVARPPEPAPPAPVEPPSAPA